MAETLERAGLEIVRLTSDRVARLANSLRLVRPRNLIGRARERVGQSVKRMELGIGACVVEARHRLSEKTAELDALSPLASLARGFAQVARKKDGSLVKDSSQVDVDDRIMVRLHKGSLDCKVMGTDGES